MALLIGTGHKGNIVPVIFVDPAFNSGRISVPNGTGYTYPTNAAFGVVEGWQCYQQGGLATVPFATQYYSLFQSDGNVNVWSDFGANNDGINFGNGFAHLDQSGQNIIFDCPTAITVLGIPYHTFVSTTSPAGPFPSHYSAFPQGSTNYQGRYSIGVELTRGAFPYTNNKTMYWSDWFDVIAPCSPLTNLFAFRTSQQGVRILWQAFSVGIGVEKSYDNGVTWQWVNLKVPPTPFSGNGSNSLYQGQYFDDPYSYRPGTGWPIYRVSDVCSAFGLNFPSVPVSVNLDGRYNIPDPTRELLSIIGHV